MRETLLRWLRVPAEPQPPAGDAASLRIFRAAPNFYRYRLLALGGKQLAALVGVGLVATAMFAAHGGGARSWMDLLQITIEIVAVAAFFLQATTAFLLVKLDYELRWYMVTDRSLRLRAGILVVREQTLTFANIQNLEITQGPLQKLLGIADLKVQTAGGGAGLSAQERKKNPFADMHVATFSGVDNAAEIREMILARLKHYRDAGLGDREDRAQTAPAAAPAPIIDAALLRELVAAGRKLRRAAEAVPPAGARG